MPKFRKKPVVIEARRFSGDVESHGLARWCGGRLHLGENPVDPRWVIDIPTLEGTMRAEVGDWIIRGVKGEFYSCKPDIFAATYEPVEESPDSFGNMLTGLGFPADEAVELRADELAAVLDDRVAASHEAIRAKLAEVERERDEAVSRSERVSSFAATLIGNACERHSAEIAVMGFHEFQQVQPKSCHWCCDAERDRLAAEVDRLKAGFVVDGETSDGYHTFNELYAYRKALHALLANEWARRGLYDVHKSWRHSDGELCFGGGWFIVVAELPEGQVSNHYKAADWALFQVPERERGNTYDGHTPAIALERLLARAALAEAPIPAREEGQ